MRNLIKLISALLTLIILIFCKNVSGQIFRENVDYFPEFDMKSVTIINVKDTVKVLYVTDSTIVVWQGNGPYDSLKLNDHLAIYRIEQVTSFYHRKKGYIIPKTIGYSLAGAVSGIFLGAAVSGDGDWDKLEGAVAGLMVGTVAGGSIGLLSGFANYEKYDWRIGDSLSLNLKKVRKHQACSYILPYHLYKTVKNVPLK